MKLDDIDVRIIQSLLNDARIKASIIAKECETSISVISKRLKKLKKQGIIRKAVLTPNMAFFGYPIMASIGVNLNPFEENKIINLIKKNAIVAGIDKTIGEYDLCIFVFSQSIEKLNILKKMMIKLNNIYNIDINIWTKPQINYSNIII